MILNQLLSIYLLFALVRCVYTICVGFLYVPKSLKNNKNYIPLATIVIPAWNEEVGIGKTIESVLKSSYKNLEILVVNDGSKDNTAKIVEEYSKKYKKLRLINKPQGGKSSALNRGIKESKGEIIITIDADSYIYPNAIKKLISELSNKEVDGAIGNILIGNTNSFIGLIQYFEYLFGFHSKKSQQILDSIYILPGALTALRKTAIVDVGYYEDYTKTEDFDISIKIKSKGYKISYVDDAICVTEGAPTFSGLINQRTRWRHGFLQCMLYRKEFLTNLKKGYYLSFVELPLAILGVLDILLFPLFIAFIIINAFTIHNPEIFLLSYFVLPFTYILLIGNELFKNKRLIKYFILIPFLFSIINTIEFIALIKSIYRLITKKETLWTNWVRVGLQN